MPETRLERALFALGLAAVAALGFLIVRLWHNRHGVAAAPLVTTSTRSVPVAPETTAAATKRTPTPATTTITATAGTTTAALATTKAAATTTRTAATRAAATTTATSTTTATAAAKAGRIRLTLTATRGDSWIEVHNGSTTGPIVYAGTLTHGSAKTFRAAALFVRFGEAGNVDASIDGHARQLPVGTYTARFDSAGYAFVHS